MPGISSPSVVVTIPVRNEADRILNTICALKSMLDKSGLTFQIAIAEDGSTDGTKQALDRTKRDMPELLVRSEERPLGRGRALRNVWTNFEADVYCFTDADLACGTVDILKAINLVLCGEDIVIGSRYAKGAKLTRPPLRSLTSVAYNGLIRLCFNDGVKDHQCGMKVFSKRAVEILLPLAIEDSWFWDTQVVVMAHHIGIPIKELPVTWVENKSPRTPLSRLLSDIYLHGSGLLRLKGQLGQLKSNGSFARTFPQVKDPSRVFRS